MKLNKKESNAIKSFKTIVKTKLKENLLEIKLFGSKARGDSKKDSDVDLLVIISNGSWKICDFIYEVATDVLLDTGISLSPKVITIGQYNILSNNGNNFMRNINQEGIAV